MAKKALVFGGTGAMGVYLVPKLVERGYIVDVLSLDNVVSEDDRIRYIQANVMDLEQISKLLENNYDILVDFMTYSTVQFLERYRLYLDKVKHYYFFSTYRIYDNYQPITEGSPRLADTQFDPVYVNCQDYSFYKARQEDILRNSETKNWTIFRPAVTYSKRRFQLVTLEAEILVWRMMRGKTVLLPEKALDCQATMSWAGDVAEMIARIIDNPNAGGETFTIATAEHHTWREIAEYYKEIGGLDYIAVDTEDYLKCLSAEENIHIRQQVTLDRFFDRVVDNSKILKFTGMKQEDLMPLKEGLKREYANLTIDTIKSNEGVNERMDEMVKKYRK